jgi:TonB-linked SusC/RagA family outer membrane protein
MYKFYYTNGYGVTNCIRKSITGLWQNAWCPNIRKWFMRINLTCLILLIAFMQAALAANAQKISLSKKNAPLTEVFKELRKQSGYDFLINKDQIKMSRPVTIQVNGTELIDVLDKCFKGQPFTYRVEDKMIVVVDKRPEQTKVEFLQIEVKGRIVGENGQPLVGASVKVKGMNRATKTNEKGEFYLADVDENAILVISYLGYVSKEVAAAATTMESIILTIATGKLEEVVVVSTGYQTIPKERATGAFTQIDTKTLNRNVGVNIIDRLDGVTSGVLINRGLPAANSSKVSVRGRSTIFANAEPLIILDGFPYEGTVEQINPADVSSITILKDAAAASIWGTRASNGVIVITMKEGKRNQKLAIGISSTLTISDIPNLKHKPQLSSSDYIGLEQFLFRNGYYDDNLTNGHSPISFAVEIMNKTKNGEITSADSLKQINELKGNDVRSDIAKYIYRPKIYQQYHLNLAGGSENTRYYLSAGYDKNLENLITNSYDRLTLNAKNNFSFLKDRLEISSDINFTSSNTKSKYDAYSPKTPYERLKGVDGTILSVLGNLRQTYVDTAGNGKLLDWNYRPLEELTPNQHDHRIQYKIKVGVNYRILAGLDLSSNYQYLNERGGNKRDFQQSDYYARNIINQYTSILGNDVTRIVPLGNIQNNDDESTVSKFLRLQLNYKKLIGENHEINALAGYEGSDSRSNINNQFLYGYNPQTLTNANNQINPLIYYPYYYSADFSNQIPTAPTFFQFTNITQSYYTNISYTYKNKYTLSGSARKDESNLFGVNSNQKGVPLWSTGLAWTLNKESFYDVDWLPSLKIRVTYGYNGNVDKTVSGYLTVVNYGFLNEWGNNYSTISNPPNPYLRWEKVKTWNLGLDYSSKNNRISGSIDFYQKNAIDLIGNNPISFQSGVTQFKGNGANLLTKGIDAVINSRNLVGDFQWKTSFLLNYNTDKVTKYDIKQTSNVAIISNNYANPLIGFPYYSIFSFPSAGLDASGSPQGYLNGAISKTYSLITGTLDASQIKYHGSATPKYFGSLINSFGYKNFELSFNLTYKFDYYFRRSQVFSGSLYTYLMADYDKRWQKPGDELTTKIPGLVFPQNDARNTFFNYSEDLVERGDHIRLQDIRFSYQLNVKKLSKTPFKNTSFFIYSQNLGIIWRKNKVNIDPDYLSSFPQPFSCSLGINLYL